MRGEKTRIRTECIAESDEEREVTVGQEKCFDDGKAR